MDKETNLIEAAKTIEDALRAYVDESERHQIHVFESSPRYLRAVVGSDRFRNVGISKRQEVIWAYLNKKVAKQYLRFCWGVDVMDNDEYYSAHFPEGSSSSSAYPHIEE